MSDEGPSSSLKQWGRSLANSWSDKVVNTHIVSYSMCLMTYVWWWYVGLIFNVWLIWCVLSAKLCFIHPCTFFLYIAICRDTDGASLDDRHPCWLCFWYELALWFGLQDSACTLARPFSCIEFGASGISPPHADSLLILLTLSCSSSLHDILTCIASTTPSLGLDHRSKQERILVVPVR